MQWIGVVLYNNTAYNIINVNHGTLFPLHPPLMNLEHNRYLVLQANIHFRSARLKRILKLLERKRLGTRWAEYMFMQCPSVWTPEFT